MMSALPIVSARLSSWR